MSEQIIESSISSVVISWLLLGTKIVGGVLLTLIAILYTNQEKMLYMPNPPGFPRTPSENPAGYQSPATWSTTGRMIHAASTIPQERIEFEEHFVKTEDGLSLHVWLLLQPNSQHVPTLIYFHGNAGNMGFLLKNAALMFAHSKINILLMDYRGYGQSEGIPSEKGINLDADAVLKFACAHPRLNNSPMMAFGRSLGGAVAIALAQRYPKLISGVIVENTFLSVGAMVDVLMPFLKPLRNFVLFMSWDSDVKIVDLKMPILFISGDADELVPSSHMRSLYNYAANCCDRDFYSVRNGTHNDTFEVAGIEYYQRLRKFAQKLLLRSQSQTDNIDTNNSNVNTGYSTDLKENKEELKERKMVSPTAVVVEDGSICSGGSSTGLDEEGYLLVDTADPSANVALPTMTTNFQVK